MYEADVPRIGVGEDKLRADPGENIRDYYSLDGGKGLEFLQQHRRARNKQESEFSQTRRNVWDGYSPK